MQNSSSVRAAKHLGFAVLLAGALGGCNEGRTPTAPTNATTPTLAAPPTPSATGSLYGVVTEMTATGPTPVEGVVVAPLSCARVACPASEKFIYQEVATGKDGNYRVPDLYNGEANYIWIASKEGYVAAESLPASACEGCNLIVTVNGDTRLDIRVVRR